MNRSIALLAVLAALSTAACAGSSSEASADSSAAATAAHPAVGHHAAVVACEAAEKKAGETAMSTMDMVEMEGNFQDCLAKANDAAVPVIEKLLKDNESARIGGVKSALESARKANQALCFELHNASSSYGGTLQHIEDASCIAEREHFIAAIIDDMVAFDGVEATYIKEDRASHGDCYKAYDANPGESTAGMIQANGDLIECIDKQLATVIDATAKAEVENDASFGPQAAANARVKSLVDAHTEKLSGFCGAIAEAGENGIGTLTRVSSAACAVRVTEAAYTLLKQSDVQN